MSRRNGKGPFALASALVLLAGAAAAPASIVGTNPPAQMLTRERIEQLPAAQRGAWFAYLERSQKQRQADKAAFQAELKRAGITTPSEPPHGFSARSVPLDRDPSWYASADARHIADVVVSFQTPAGGWGKNLNMSEEPRRPGERYGPNNVSRFLAPGDFDTPRDPDWNYIGTIDNDATTTQINFLAKVISAIGVQNAAVYRAAFLRGIDYLLEAQFPNGGWPQVWPLEGGYHDAITYNDAAMTRVMELVHNVSEGRAEFAFVPKSVRAQAAASFARGIRCILATQIVSNGVLTVWPQQDDALTLKPVSGRNYELPAECSGESVNVLLLLMNDLPRPDAAEQRSIHAAAAWFKETEIYGESWERTPKGRELVASPGAGPIWSRYYQIGTNRPIFGDRDKSIHDNVNELSRERRNGYSWFGAGPERALDDFAKWSQEHQELK